MKPWMIGLAILVVLALDWAALHDILKRNEPNYWAEYAMLAASVVLLPLLARAMWRAAS